MQGVEHLQVWKAIQKYDADGELVGMLHLLDGFLAPMFGEIPIAPVVEQPVMQPILVDGCQLSAQRGIEILNDFRIALHFFLRYNGIASAGCVPAAV